MEKLSLPLVGGHGSLSGRTERFLLRALHSRTVELYVAALRAFSGEVEDAGFAWGKASTEERDAFLADWIVGLEEGGWSRQVGVTLVAALHKVCPREHFRAAKAVLNVWAQLATPRQAPACPEEAARALAVLALAAGRPDVSAVIVLCFYGVMRVSEPLRLGVNDVMRLPGALGLVLGKTKRGLEQKVVIRDVWAADWMAHYRHAPVGSAVRGVPCSYGKVRYWLDKLSSALELVGPRMTSHSFRRGGASHLLANGMPVADVCLFGRWASVQSATPYLRRGEAFLLRFRHLQQPQAWARLLRFARVPVCEAWAAFKAFDM